MFQYDLKLTSHFQINYSKNFHNILVLNKEAIVLKTCIGWSNESNVKTQTFINVVDIIFPTHNVANNVKNNLMFSVSPGKLYMLFYENILYFNESGIYSNFERIP